MITHYIFSYGFVEIEPSSAQYAVSSLFQGEAAILGIVVTISLVAVQQAASNYTPKIIKIFEDINKNADFYILIVVYILSMVYSLWVLFQINFESESILDFDKYILFKSFKYHLIMVYSLGVFSLITLIAYSLNTLYLLNPYTIISLLSEDITLSNIAQSIAQSKPMQLIEPVTDPKQPKTMQLIEPVTDPIQPIVDIVNTSINKRDKDTVIFGLNAIESKVMYILKNNSEDFRKDQIKLTKMITRHLEDSGILAIDKDSQFCTTRINRLLYLIAAKTIEQRMHYASLEATRSIERISIYAIDNQMKTIAEQVVTFYISELFPFYLKNKLYDNLNHGIRVLINIDESISKDFVEEYLEIKEYLSTLSKSIDESGLDKESIQLLQNRIQEYIKKDNMEFETY